MLLVFALINRPDIFDLRSGNSFVEFLIEEGYDVFLLDWGVFDESDSDIGLEYFVCEEIPSGIRETLRASGQDEVSVLGWCIGGTLSLLHCGLEPDTPVRNLLLLTTPGRHERLALLQVDRPRLVRRRPRRGRLRRRPRPVDRLREQADEAGHELLDHVPAAVAAGLGGRGPVRPDAYQAMAKWVADNPPFPGRAYREWITWMYKENRLVRDRMRLTAGASTCAASTRTSWS